MPEALNREGQALQEEQYLSTLQLIHEAAFCPAGWDTVLRRLAELTGCVAGGLTHEDPRTGQGAPITYFGFDPSHVERTFEYFLPMNPLFGIAHRMQPGFIVTNGDVVPLEDFRRSEFYNGWARPQGLCSPITLVTHRTPGKYLPLTLVKPDGAGEASTDDRAIIARFRPHLVHAMTVALQLEQARTRQDQLVAALACLSNGAILIDNHRRLLFTNTAAEVFLGHSARQPLSTAQGELVARDPACDSKLQASLSLALTTGTPRRGTTVAIQRPGGVSPITLTLSPLPQAGAWTAAAETDGAGLPACLVLIDDCGVSALAREYHLTPAETRLVEAVMVGKGLSWAARELGVGRSTAQSHMDKVFQKTRTNRQAELVALAHAGRQTSWHPS